MRMNQGGRIAFGGFQLTPIVKILLIANVAIYVLQVLIPNVLEQWAAFNTTLAFQQFQIWRLGTYMFLHGGVGHLFFNMLALWIFGTAMEALWGQRTFLIYYLVCGLGGALLYGLFALFGIGGGWMLGASGAIMGLLLAYGMTYPDNLLFLFGFIPIKAKYLVVLMGLMDLLSIPRSTGVAHLAHLGGLLTGFIFIQLTIPSLSKRMFGGTLSGMWKRNRARRRMRVVPPQESSGGARQEPRSEQRASGGNGGNGRFTRSSAGGGGDTDQTRIDEILDKISREGLQSLTDEEQELLRRAGRK